MKLPTYVSEDKCLRTLFSLKGRISTNVKENNSMDKVGNIIKALSRMALYLMQGFWRKPK
jgi:hypothetical protein